LVNTLTTKTKAVATTVLLASTRTKQVKAVAKMIVMPGRTLMQIKVPVYLACGANTKTKTANLVVNDVTKVDTFITTKLVKSLPIVKNARQAGIVT
jgi:hypothetical protein